MDKIVSIYKKCVLAVCSVFEIIAALSLVGMFVTVFYHVIMRYFFANAPGWGEELARIFMVIFAFIGVALGVRDKLHIALTLFAEGPLRKILLPMEIFAKFLILVLGIMMSSFMGPYFTMLKYNRLPGTGMPVGYQYLVPTVIGVLVSLIALYQIYDHFKYGTDENQKNLAVKKEGN
ncbi:MAG: TRAP transporter small permease [Treponema sp.]|jgi:TRAP-type C4-dicarboxylate transport system permease small subunit|nr:TRAP transporter small permease [Treponema sp.]